MNYSSLLSTGYQYQLDFVSECLVRSAESYEPFVSYYYLKQARLWSTYLYGGIHEWRYS